MIILPRMSTIIPTTVARTCAALWLKSLAFLDRAKEPPRKTKTQAMSEQGKLFVNGGHGHHGKGQSSEIAVKTCNDNTQKVGDMTHHILYFLSRALLQTGY